MRFNSGLEYEQADRSVSVGLNFFEVGIQYRRHIVNERNHIAEEFHHAAHTHILESAHAEYRVDAAVDKTLTNTFAHFVLGEGALFEEFVHKTFVVFGCCFHELLVEFLSAVEFFGWDFADGRHATFRTPFILLHKKHIDKCIESGAGIDWVLNRCNSWTESFYQLVKSVLVISLFAIELVYGKHNRLVDIGYSAENVLSTYFNTILCVNKDYAGVGYIKSSHCVTHEVVATRTVNYIELLIEEFCIDYRWEYRVAIFLFYREIVAYGVSLFDRTSSFYNSTLKKHCFCECGFTRALTSEKSDVFDFVCLINFHVIRN